MILNSYFQKSAHVKSFLFCGLILLSTIGMTNIIMPYLSWKWNVDFLMTKQFIIHLDHYRFAFYIHIFSSLVILFSGAFLFSSYVLKHYSKLHRNIGKVYVGLLLGLSAPSGLIMAYYANGGIWVKISFLILTPLWWYFTYKGYTSIRHKKVKAHKAWMTRSYALTLSAISLRGYQFIFGYTIEMNPEMQYLLISWISWVGNLLIAEVYIRYLGTGVRVEFFKVSYLLNGSKNLIRNI